MTDLRTWAKKLRQTADAIDAIYQVAGTKGIARKILKHTHDTPGVAGVAGRRKLTKAQRKAIGRRVKAAWRARKANGEA